MPEKYSLYQWKNTGYASGGHQASGHQGCHPGPFILLPGSLVARSYGWQARYKIASWIWFSSLLPDRGGRSCYPAGERSREGKKQVVNPRRITQTRPAKNGSVLVDMPQTRFTAWNIVTFTARNHCTRAIVFFISCFRSHLPACWISANGKMRCRGQQRVLPELYQGSS